MKSKQWNNKIAKQVTPLLWCLGLYHKRSVSVSQQKGKHAFAFTLCAKLASLSALLALPVVGKSQLSNSTPPPPPPPEKRPLKAFYLPLEGQSQDFRRFFQKVYKSASRGLYGVLIRTPCGVFSPSHSVAPVMRVKT